MLEHDPDVLAYWDQPEGIKITYLSGNGRLTSPTTTPDYIVVRKESVELIEVKPEAALPELALEMPNRFVCGEDRQWRCPPAEKAVEAYGFRYRIWTSAEVSPVWLANIQVLADYFGAAEVEVAPETMTHVRELVCAEPRISLAEVRRRCSAATADHLNFMLVRDTIYTDLAAAPLTQPEKVWLYASRELAEIYQTISGGQTCTTEANNLEREFKAGSTCRWNGRPYTVGNLGAANVTLLADGAPVELKRDEFARYVAAGDISSPTDSHQPSLCPEATELLRQAGREELEIALRRCAFLQDRQAARAAGISPRTLRRWDRLSRLAQQRFGHGLFGLLHRFRDRGNHHPRFSDQLLTLIDKIIDDVYCTAARPNKAYAYRQLRVACETQGFAVPSYANFTQGIRMRDQYRLTLAREGKRVAHKFELIRPGEVNDNHGLYPWDVVYIDHTLADIELVCTETGVNLGRVWLSMLLDGFSRRVLAFVLSFDPPSYRTLMLLFRRCVERHQRLPRTVVIDGGPEFRSTYFETLAAAYAVALRRRPPGKPKFGTLIERAFGTVNTAFLHALAGNTLNTKNIRQLTKSMNPMGHAIWTLEELHELLTEFLFVVYDQRPHPAFNCPPAQKYTMGMDVAGARAHQTVANDETFYLMTLPCTRKGTAKLQPGMGFKLFGAYYWADEMRQHRVEGSSVEVRYDPENLGVAWARIGGQWVRCRYHGALNLEGRTEKELRIATLEWCRSRQGLGQRQSDSMTDFAAFLRSAEATKKLQMQQAKDRAFRRIAQRGLLSEGGDREASAAVPRLQLEPPPATQAPSPEVDAILSSAVERYDDF